jgi:predicted nucleic acid-binding protein
MSRIVVDNNIVFAAIHTKNSLTRKKLLSMSEQLVSCNFLFIEIFKHKERIFKNASASDDEIYDYLEKILHRIHFFNEELISTESFFKAYHLCKDIDLKDIAYVALSIELNAPLWTRDNKLKQALIQKGFTHFFED